MVRPSARVKVADSTAFDHPGIDPDSKLVRHIGLAPQTSRQGPKQVCYSHTSEPCLEQVQRQIKKFDEDGSGTLDLEEFEAFVSSI